MVEAGPPDQSRRTLLLLTRISQFAFGAVVYGSSEKESSMAMLSRKSGDVSQVANHGALFDGTVPSLLVKHAKPGNVRYLN